MSELVRVVNGEFKGFVGVTSGSGLILPGVPNFSEDVSVNEFQLPIIPDWISRKNDEKKMREHYGSHDRYVDFSFTQPGLYHFTSFSNLARILETGLVMSRNLAKSVSGYEKYGDERTHGELRIQDKVRTTWVSNNPILASFEGYRAEGEQAFPPCIIEFDFSTAFLDGAVYFDGNANSTLARHGKSLEFFLGLNFQSVYNTNLPIRDHFDIGNGVDEEEYDSALKHFNSAKQAEVHFPFALPVNFIKQIYFRTNAEKNYALELMPELKNYRFALNVSSGHFTKKTRLDEVYIRESHETKVQVPQENGVHIVANMMYIYFRIMNGEADVSAHLIGDNSLKVEFGKSKDRNYRAIDVSGLKGDFRLSLYFGDKETYRTKVRIV